MSARNSHQLVSIELDGPSVKYRVPEETKTFLASFDTDITPIAAVGPYRSGKSWMLGFLSKQPEAFHTSNGSQACTRGIHINTQPFTTKNLLFMDTEGLGAPGSNVEIDSKILACAILFAAKVYFFVVGKIDTKVLDSLQCAIGTANWLKDAANQQCFNFQRPQLVVVVKDLTLQLQDKNGKPIDSNQYFKTCLEDYCVSNDSELQTAINSLFSSVTCLTTTIPCAEQDMKEMKNLYPKFRSDVAAVACDAYNATQTKSIAEHTPMNGPILLQMAEQLCAALSLPGAPRLLNVWQAVMEQAAIERKHKLLAQFRKTIANQKNTSRLYLTSVSLQDTMQQITSMFAQCNQSFKHNEIAELLQAMFAETQEPDQLRVETLLATQKPLSQLVIDHLPDSLTNIAQALRSAEIIELENEELKKDLQNKSDALMQIEDQIATLAAANPQMGDATEVSTDLEQKLEESQRSCTQAQAYADEILVMHTTFQTEIKEQVAKNIELNDKLKHDIQAAQQELQQANKKIDELNMQIHTNNATTKQLKSTIDDTTRKRKLDELQDIQLKTKLEHALKRYAEAEQRCKDTQDRLRYKDDELQKMRLELMQANCRSILQR